MYSSSLLATPTSLLMASLLSQSLHRGLDQLSPFLAVLLEVLLLCIVQHCIVGMWELGYVSCSPRGCQEGRQWTHQILTKTKVFIPNKSGIGPL